MPLHSLHTRLRQCNAGDPRYVEPQASFAVASTGSPIFVLQTNASSTGLAAVLVQEFEDSLYPVCFASRKLLDREKRYSTIERECLAILWAVHKINLSDSCGGGGGGGQVCSPD